jgi:hypothetical protein
MPDIDALMEKASKKKFKKSSYRPWNYLEEIEKEEEAKQQEIIVLPVLAVDNVDPDETEISELAIATDDHVEASPLDVIHTPEPTIMHAVTSNEPSVTAKENININAVYQEDAANPLYTILRLSGHQKTIFAFILERCLSRGLLSSGVVTSEMLTSITNTSLSMVNTSIQRLVEKGLLFRENGKRGRGGFYCFGLSQSIKDAAIEYRKLATLDNTDSTRLHEVQVDGYELSRIDSRKQSTILPYEWEEIDIEPLSPISFSRSHLIQLYKQGDLDHQSIQDSIYHFSFDLKYNNKSSSITKSSPIGYFMGILKRSGVYNAPDNYESPKDRALRDLLERKKMEKEKRDTMVKELINIAFDDWQAKLSQEEKDLFIPEDIRKGRLMAAKVSSLRTYFTEHVWPQLAPKEVDLQVQ